MQPSWSKLPSEAQGEGTNCTRKREYRGRVVTASTFPEVALLCGFPNRGNESTQTGFAPERRQTAAGSANFTLTLATITSRATDAETAVLYPRRPRLPSTTAVRHGFVPARSDRRIRVKNPRPRTPLFLHVLEAHFAALKLQKTNRNRISALLLVLTD